MTTLVKLCEILEIIATRTILLLGDGVIDEHRMQNLRVFRVREHDSDKLAIATDRFRLPLVVRLLQHTHLRFDSLDHLCIYLLLNTFVVFVRVVAIRRVIDQFYLDLLLLGRLGGLGLEAFDF
jgi:hypothetical protein